MAVGLTLANALTALHAVVIPNTISLATSPVILLLFEL